MNRRLNGHHQPSRLLAAIFIAAATAVAEQKQCAACRILVSIPDHKLVLLDGERVVWMYDVATGKPSTPSPRGEFRIANRVQHPTWYGPHGTVRPGSSNPLGTRWLGLSLHGFGIHGTNAPDSIGKDASHGCIRMKNGDVEELFNLVPVGAAVELIGEHSDRFDKLLAEAD